jgi:DNA mismatch endonuclease (patch repair protein)
MIMDHRESTQPGQVVPSTAFASSEAIHRKMSAQPSHDTGPELALRSALHRLGLRYQVHRYPIPALRRQADIVFPRQRVAVFVDGCFWHGCEQHGRRKHDVNGWYWPSKIARNRARDEDTTQRLTAEGWAVIRIWEHEQPEMAARLIQGLVQERRRPGN